MSSLFPRHNQEPPQLDYLEEIKTNIRRMPYGDLIEMANGCKAVAGNMWKWAINAHEAEEVKPT